MTTRREYLLEVAGLMWPGADVSIVKTPLGSANARVHGPGQVRQFVLVPSANDPRLVLPAGAPAAAAHAATGFTGHRSGSAGLRGRVLSGTLRSGVGDRVLRDRLVIRGSDGLDTHLSTVLGTEVLISMHVGPARANRKPVLQLTSTDGRILGYAKIGFNPLTAELVDAEAEALAAVGKAGLRTIVAPELLHHGHWGELAIVVQSPLPAASSVAASPAAMVSAMVELARSSELPESPLIDAPYVRRLSAALADLGPDGNRLSLVVESLVALPEHVPVAFGAWHGDWTTWNCADAGGGRLLVWDWERYAAGVPIGFDALHQRLQSTVHGLAVIEPAHATAVIEAAPELLRPFGVPADVAGMVAVLYLCEIACRYLTDRQADAGGRLGRVGEWLVPAVEPYVAGLTHRGRTPA